MTDRRILAPSHSIMPTLPLYEIPADANAWHRVRTPGGYEYWRFEARDLQKGIDVALTFSLGGFLRHDYEKKVASYLRRPTRTLPPAPSDFPAVMARISMNGRETTEQLTPHASEFQASTPPTVIRFTDDSMQWDASGICRIEFHGEQLQIDLAFEPRTDDAHQRTPTDEHHQIASMSSGQFTGALQWDGRAVSFTGTGMYEHRFGIRPRGRTRPI